MEIETYEIEDATSEASTMANDAVALELIEKLGLTGQQKLMNKETVTRVPYRVMEEQEFQVYKALCPTVKSPADYDLDPIPVRILQVIAYAQSLEFFTKLEIWCPNPAIFRDDPVLVGLHKRKNQHGWNDDVYYILARWGKVLRPLAELLPMAVTAMRTRRLNKLREIHAECEQEIAKAERTSDLKVLSQEPSSYLSS